MSQASPPAAATPAAPADSLRIVLFGMPAAGKSSLIGALGQAAQLQEHLLNGRLTDLTHGLAELRTRLYDENARRTAEEVMPYPVDFEPFTSDGQALTAHQHLGAVVIDCDGRIANDLLARHKELPEDSPDGTLAREVLQADTLVLVVDGAAPASQIDADFVEFEQFLRLLERGRGERTEVGGLPVFLVLTKCDLLALPDETAGGWMEKIEQRKRDVDAHFREFLSRRNSAAGPLPFGRIDLHLWATAVKRPALAQTPAKAREPFGVAELFRQCLEQGAAFRSRGQQAARRLRWTVGGTAGIAASMLALIVGLAVTNRDTPTSELQNKVENERYRDKPTPAERLHGTLPELHRHLAVFQSLRDDPGFANLPGKDQDYVRERVDELQEYLSYYEKLQGSRRPGEANSVETLQEIEGELRNGLALPHAEWGPTDAGRLHAERLLDAEALAQAVTRLQTWYDDSADKARDLWTFSRYKPTPDAPAINWRTWNEEVERLLDPARAAPFGDKEPIAGTTLTYGAAQRFARIVEARADWDTLKNKLNRVRDLSAALGLNAAVKDRPALLVVPRPPDFSLERARSRVQELQGAYPNFQRDFVLTGLPDAVVPEVRQAARTNYDYLLKPAREAVLQQLQASGTGEAETVSRWEKVSTWLAGNPQELAAWRVLALVLARLNDADAIDPVTALVDFLQKSKFTIDVRLVTLEVPESYRARPAAGANLAVYHPATNADQPAIVCEPSGEGERDAQRRVMVYKFRAGERQRLTYTPGDVLWASLALREGQIFSWMRCRSTTYQFERLLLPPRLHKSNEPSNAGTPADNVRLTITPADGVPGVPDLLPEVRLAK